MSTAIVVTLVAAGFMLANAATSTTATCPQGFCIELLPPGYTAVYKGWPYSFWTEYGDGKAPNHQQIFTEYLYADILLGVGALMLAGILSERFIRRREARKP